MQRVVMEASPEEGCGLVLGTAGVGLEVVPVENALHSPTRFRLEGAAQVRALLRAEEKGWELVAVFHSHPQGPSCPSPTDLAEASYPDALCLIWAPGKGRRWECLAFELRGVSVAEGAREFVPARVVSEE
jgi:proteasome lid subunit RPN8/RPN11